MISLEEYKRTINPSSSWRDNNGGRRTGEGRGTANNGSIFTAPKARRFRSRLHSLAFLLVRSLT